MMGTILLWSLFTSIKIADVQEGDCLSISDIQNLVGVDDSNVYIAGECQSFPGYLVSLKSHPAVCQESLQIEAWMEWQRILIDHSPPGLGGGASKCMTSVLDADYHRQSSTKIQSDVACFEDNSFISLAHHESFKSKEVRVGFGKLFLPSPLIVSHQEWATSPMDQTIQLVVNTEAELRMKYLGWGKFEATWKKSGLGSVDGDVCKIAKLKPGKNAEQKDCVQITKLSDCP